MSDFLTLWNEAATTSLGFFWMALWAFILGYIISSLIQVLVTRKKMQQAMGKDGPRSIALGTFFGFLSSSCSFSALASTRAIFNKGAGLVLRVLVVIALIWLAGGRYRTPAVTMVQLMAATGTGAVRGGYRSKSYGTVGKPFLCSRADGRPRRSRLWHHLCSVLWRASSPSHEQTRTLP